jgi:hypothetical protein
MTCRCEYLCNYMGLGCSDVYAITSERVVEMGTLLKVREL